MSKINFFIPRLSQSRVELHYSDINTSGSGASPLLPDSKTTKTMFYLRICTLVLAATMFSYLYSIADGPAVIPTAGDVVRTEESTNGQDIADNDSTVQDLDELIIVQTKKLVQSDGAKLTYNASEDPEAKTGSLLDILRKVPGVTVDAEENVKVNGQSSFKILINNREDPMLKGDIKSVLKSLPGSSIRKIEVISEPGAKYDAEGTGGILNIVTEGGRNLSGFNTRFNAWVNAWQVGGSANGRFKIGNVMLGADISYNNGNVWPRSTISDVEIEDLTGSSDYLQKRHREMKNGFDYEALNIDMSWEPDTLNLFTFNGNLYGYGNNNTTNESNSMFATDLTQLWRVDQLTSSRNKSLGGGLQASYQHTFNRTDNTLVVSYMFDAGKEDGHTNSMTTDSEGEVEESPYIRQTDSQPYMDHTVQVDYSNQFNTHHKLEAGGKLYFSDYRSSNRYYSGPDDTKLTEDDDQSVRLKQFKDIYAIYASYTGTFSKFGVKAGLRYEHTRMGLRYTVGSYPDFTTYLNDIVPNGALSYNFTNASTLRLAYQMRISRPWLWALNPYRDSSTPGIVKYGNPDLQSVRSHDMSIGYTNYDNALTGGIKATYRYVNNSITDVLFMRDGLMNSTYANVGTDHTFILSANADWRITDDLQWSVWVSPWYNYLHADNELVKATNKGWNCAFSTNINYTFPFKMRLSAYGGYQTGWMDLQSKGDSGYWYGLGLSRSWLEKDALSVSLNIGTLFPIKRTNGYVQQDESVRYTQRQTYSQWNVGLSVSYTFGTLSANVKKTAANIEKEETQGSGGGNK